jgi:hypothetical protein
LSLFEHVDDSQPAFSGCGESQERRETLAESAAPLENVEPRGLGGVRGLAQEARGDQGLERLGDLRNVIPDVLGQALADEKGPWMPIEEQQQVEIARVPQAPDAVKELADSLRRHERGSVYVPSVGRARRHHH